MHRFLREYLQPLLLLQPVHQLTLSTGYLVQIHGVILDVVPDYYHRSLHTPNTLSVIGLYMDGKVQLVYPFLLGFAPFSSDAGLLHSGHTYLPLVFQQNPPYLLELGSAALMKHPVNLFMQSFHDFSINWQE